MDELYALLKRRGVLWPSAEIYGGTAGLYDYGPLGHALKRRIESAWETWFLGLSPQYYRIEPAEILPEAAVRASGHLENFTDPEAVCESCHQAFRADTVLEKVRPEGVDGLTSEQIGALVREHHVRCPSCGRETLTVPKPFNLMFGVDLGVTGKERGYLLPETAQASYLAFPRMWDVGRRSLPLGIGVIAHAYRNEIAPRQVLFRLRAFTQAELQIFFDPSDFAHPLGRFGDLELPVVRAEARLAGDEAVHSVPARILVESGDLPEFYVYHLVQSYRFYRDVLGYRPDTIRFYEKSKEERAFYNRIQFDIEVRLESLGGFKELGAVHYRGDYDLDRHGKGTGTDLSVKPTDRERVLPHVLELTLGIDRILWALADQRLGVEDGRTVWKLPSYLAPVPVAVFPLIWKEHSEEAERIVELLRGAGLAAVLDDAGTIGKRYARNDEAGTPFCITVDKETVDPAHANHGTVTLRLRDTRAQERIAIAALPNRLAPIRLFPRPLTAAPAAGEGPPPTSNPTPIS
jgi:glycyl-tRNA synthetase